MTTARREGRRAGWCDECGLESTLTCSVCKVGLYCGKVCQTIAWKTGHKRECAILKAGGVPPPPPAPKTEDKAFATKVRVEALMNVVRDWLAAKHVKNEDEQDEAEARFVAMGRDASIAYSPSVPPPFQQALLTASRLLFTYTCTLLSPAGISQLNGRLRFTPPFDADDESSHSHSHNHAEGESCSSDDTPPAPRGFPGFTGKEASDPAGLSGAQYNWLMRLMGPAIMGLIAKDNEGKKFLEEREVEDWRKRDKEMTESWVQLGLMGVQLWEQ